MLFQSVAALRSWCQRHRGTAPCELIVTVDTRPPGDKTYFAPFCELVKCWGARPRRHVLQVFGEAATVPLFENVPMAWLKVFVLREILNFSTVFEYIVWLDSDATVVPHFQCMRAQDRFAQGRLQFDSARAVWARHVLATSDRVCFLGYREAICHGRCPAVGCSCKVLYSRLSECRGEPGNRGQHHSFNAGVFILRACPKARRLMNYWCSLRPRRRLTALLHGPGWAGRGFEQPAFDKHVIAKFPGAIVLVSQREFAPQSASMRASVSQGVPFIHFYGKAMPWTGKSLIPRWLRNLRTELSRDNLRALPCVQAYAAAAVGRATDNVATAEVAATQRRIRAIKRSVGKRIRWQGRVYPSVRAAAAQGATQPHVVRRSCVFL